MSKKVWIIIGSVVVLLIIITVILMSNSASLPSNTQQPGPESQSQFVEGNNNCGKIVGILKPSHISSFQLPKTNDQRLFTISCKLKVNKTKLASEGPQAKIHVLEGPSPKITIAPMTFGTIGLNINGNMEIGIPNDEWFHLVYVQKASSVLVYINGQLEEKQKNNSVSVNEVSISGDTEWHKIKDITLCTRALNLYEVQNLS